MRMEGVVSSFCSFGKELRFFVQNPADWIQRHHFKGELYENEELRLIQRHSEGARVFLDIGANVGNHAIFMAKVLNAEKVYAFEANPSTADILKLNILLNGASQTIDISYVGIGLGDKLGHFQVEYPQINNIGAARLVEAEGREQTDAAKVMVCPLDSLNIGREPQFVKIDVEGMEISVLRGMEGTIRKFRPHMFIEVANTNAGLFDEWVEKNDYVKVDSFRRYLENENFLIKHKSTVS